MSAPLTSEDDPPRPPSGGGRFRRAVSWQALLELFGLCALAVVQPVLDVMGKAPEFFLFRGAERADILLLTLAIVVLPPLVLWAVETLVGLVAGPRVGRGLHLVFLAGLGAVLGMQIAKQIVDNRTVVVIAAGVAAAAAVLVFAPRPNVRLWFRYLAPASLVFAALFLLTSPVSDLILPSDPAGASGEAGKRSPVVMMVFDEWPLMTTLKADGTIDERLYPNLARLAKTSTWYRNATTVSTNTPIAVPATTTGRFPTGKKAPTSGSYPQNLFTLLGGSHDMEVNELVTALCPTQLCPADESGRPEVAVGDLLGDSWDVWRDVVSPSRSRNREVADTLVEDVVADGTAGPKDADIGYFMHRAKKPAQFKHFLDGLQKDEGPTVHWVHTLLPHQPWRYLPSGRRYPWVDNRRGQGASTSEEWPWMQARQRMMLQALYTDRLVGQVLERLEETGLMDRAMVVLTADHGISFVPGKLERGVTDDTGDEVLWVPLLVKTPGQEKGRVDDRNAYTIDILPTIADVLEVDTHWDLDGLSLVGDEKRPDDEKKFQAKAGADLTEYDPSKWWPELLRGEVEDFALPALGPDGLYAVGPYRDLVGTQVTEQAVLPEAGARAVLQAPGAHPQFGADRGDIQNHVRGKLVEPGAGGPAEWAVVAVNDRIAGVTGFFAGDERKFAAMAAESAFQPGDNRLQLFLVRGEPGSAQLEPVDLSP